MERNRGEILKEKNMKKGIFILLFLTSFISLYGQNYYTFTWQWGQSAQATNTLARNVEVSIRKENNQEETLISGTPSMNGRRVLNLNSPLEDVILRLRWVSNGFGGSCVNSQTFNSSGSGCTIFPNMSLGCFQNGNGVSYLGLFVQISPIQIDPPTSPAPKCFLEDITVDARSTCDNLIVDRWYYTLPGQAEQYFPGHDGESVLTFNPSEITNTPRAFINQPIRLRAEYDLYPFPEVRTVSFLGCSPGQDGPIVDIQPSCSNSITSSDNGNGSFTITLDRALNTGERMNLMVYNELPTGVFDFREARVLTQTEFSGRSYTWIPRNLPGANYQLFWQTKSGSDSFDDIDLVPDAYEQSEVFELRDPPNLSITGVPTPVQCLGGNDGSITVTPIGGTPGQAPNPPYEYSIDNGVTWQTQTLFDQLTRGDYVITIRDGNGCQVNSDTIQIIERFTSIPVITNLPLTSSPTQIGGDNGQIVISIAGGSGNYTNYSWTKDGNPFTPPPGSTNTTIIDLFEGDYTLVVTDSNGCSSQPANFMLRDPEPIEIDISMTPTTLDCSYNTGVLTATASKGFLNPSGDYTYVWNDGTSGNTLSNAQIGTTYQVTVTDQGGNSNTRSFEVMGPDPVLVVVDQDPVNCKGGSDGSITLTISGGTPIAVAVNPERYDVTWSKVGDPGFSKSGIAIAELTAGFYEYEITDQNSCTYNNFGNPIEITEPPLGVEVFELVNEHVDNIIFQGEEGIIEVSVINNTGVFTIAWFKDNQPFSPPSGSSETRLVNLPQGIYSLILTDGVCTTTLSTPIEITEPELLQIDRADENDITCNGAQDGRITVTPIGGIEPYTYTWNKQGDPAFMRPDDPRISDLEPGRYTVTVTDDSGSSATVTSEVFDITQPDILDIILENQTTVTCPLGNDGTIDISVTGGTPPYTFQWNTGEITEDLQNLGVGDYTLLVEDVNGCMDQTTISVVNDPNQLTIQQENISNVSTYEGNDGSIALTVVGGQSPYNFNWIRTSDNVSVGNTNRIDNLIAGIYSVTITDGICTIQNGYEITQPDIVEPTITPLVCNGDCTASIQLEVNRGNGDFTFLWNTGENTETISNLCAGFYTVTISGFQNGDLIRTYEIVDPEPIQVELGDPKFICLGQSTTLVPTLSISNATYSWTSDNGFTSDQPEVIVQQGGMYTLVVTSSDGCIGQDTVVVNEVDAELEAEFLYSSQVFTNEKFVIIDVTNPTPEQIEWIMPDEATIVDQNQDLIELYFENPGEYEIGLVASLGDCRDIYTQKVLVVENQGLEENPDSDGSTNQLANIKEFTIFPNPSDGNFEVKVELKDSKPIRLTIFSLANNTILAQENQQGNNVYQIPFSLQLASGIYAVVLETPYGKEIRKIIVR